MSGKGKKDSARKDAESQLPAAGDADVLGALPLLADLLKDFAAPGDHTFKVVNLKGGIGYARPVTKFGVESFKKSVHAVGLLPTQGNLLAMRRRDLDAVRNKKPLPWPCDSGSLIAAKDDIAADWVVVSGSHRVQGHLEMGY